MGKKGRSPEEIEEHYSKVIELNPNDADAYSFLLVAYYFQNKEKELNNILNSLYHRDQSFYHDVMVRLSILLMENQRYPDSEQIMKRAIELKPEKPAQYVLLGDLYVRMERIDEAEEMYKKGLELAPENIAALMKIGEFYLKLEKYYEASEFFRKVIKLQPENSRAVQAMQEIVKHTVKL